MKVFISWSGPRSKAIASALRELLPDALQNVEAWMSDHEIAAGARWSNELGHALEGSAFGVICLTPENLTAPWLLFEAGSLAKSVATSRVVPYLFDLAPADVTFPLAQFQGSQATREGTLRLLQGINEVLESPMPTERVQRVFDRWWPEFEQRLQVVSQLDQTTAVRRDEREILEEILELVRRSRPNVTNVVNEPSTPKSIIWRTVHDVPREEFASMSSATLESYLKALRVRWNDTSSRGEEDVLEGRIKQVEEELASRGPAGTTTQ